MESSPLKLTAVGKRRKTAFDLSKCAICQKSEKEDLRMASPQGLSTFLKVLKIRNEVGSCSQFDGLESYLSITGNNDFVPRDSKLQFSGMPHLPAKQTYHQRTNLALLVQVQIPLL